jgi:hypothetical protein
MTNLIGISGKKGAGKDTVAEVIRFLIDREKQPDLEIQDFVNNNDPEPRDDNPWEIKKFADKLKDMVCLLIGCTREQLEHPEFKESPLGEKWVKYPVSVDTVINPLDSENCEVGEELHYFATKEEAEEFASRKTVEGYDYEAEAFVEDKEILTPRQLLQQLGTEVGRQIHPSAWVNALFVDYTSKNHNKWIISDVRFPDEAQAIKDRGGSLIKVNRDTDDDQHESETALDGYTGWDYVIDNNGSIEGLVDQVETVLKQFKII